MNYEVKQGSERLEGPFSVLDTALHAAQRITRPPPKPQKQYTHVARLSGTTDEDPYALGSAQPPRISRVTIVEREGNPGTPRLRAYVVDGRVLWAKSCKDCKGQGHFSTPYGKLPCGGCNGQGSVPGDPT